MGSPLSAAAQLRTNADALQQMADALRAKGLAEKSEAEAFARQYGLPIRTELADGTIIEIQKIKNGIPLYYVTDNAGAAHTTRTDKLWLNGGLGLALSGSGYTTGGGDAKLGEWDGGGVLLSHDELAGRVTQQDSPPSTSNHSTHVAGTMIAAGVDSDAHGMAPACLLDAYDWTDDETEMATAAAAGLEVSNHSYGFGLGWNRTGSTSWQWVGNPTISDSESYWFGYYTTEAQEWDTIAYNAPYYLIVKSAGNDRGQGPVANTSTLPYPLDGEADDWFDTIGIRSGCKNVLTVGAVIQAPGDRPAEDVAISSFSGWGPVDDGRIKPDLCGMGVGLYSASNAGDSSYTSMSGTSMSSPNVSGTLALLQEHYQNTHSGTAMRAATLKALAIHSADATGGQSGPDYRYGYGLLNAARAAQTISADTHINVIDESSLSNGGTFTRSITATGRQPLVVTIAWTDPAGTPPTPASLDPSDPMLVNDLDLRITGNGSTYYPWSLNRLNPGAAATRNGENNIDNVEQVIIDNPSAGSYTITVDHDGSLLNGAGAPGSQAFSLIISGIDGFSAVPAACSPALVFPSNGATNVPLTTTLAWQTVYDATSYDLYFGTDGAGSATPTNIVNGLNLGSASYAPNLAANTTYYVQVVPRNSQGIASGCNTIWSFTTGSYNVVSMFPFVEDFESFSGVGVGNDWYESTQDSFDWTLDSGGTNSLYTGPSDDHSANGTGNYLYAESSAPNTYNQIADLYSPVFDFSSMSRPRLSFWYHMYGLTMGDLVVDIYSGGTWHHAVVYLARQQSLDGTDWQQASIDLQPYTSGTVQQVRFRAVTGSDYYSDIAIDDVVIWDDSSVWLGYSTAWDSLGNWSNGMVPTQDDKVVIPQSPVGGYFPICTMADARAKSLQIEGGTTSLQSGQLAIGGP
jgi:hypothetical protein